MKSFIQFLALLMLSLSFCVTTYAQETTVSTPPKFPGGPMQWMSFVNKQLHKDSAVIKLPPGNYAVPFSFDVDAEGNISHITEEKNALTGKINLLYILQKSPKWIPARLNGRNTNYRHRAVINFEIHLPDADTLQ